jgi:hypothetical protein
MIETTTMLLIPAAAPTSYRFRAAVVKNSVAAVSSGDEVMADPSGRPCNCDLLPLRHGVLRLWLVTTGRRTADAVLDR